MRLAAAILATCGIPQALAQEDLDALTLADQAPQNVEEHAHAWRVLLEGAFDQYGDTPDPTVARQGGRLSVDLRYDSSLMQGLRAVLAERLDINRQAPYGTTEVSTLKEAYLSWHTSDTQILDLGRINVRNGVALGYNPTDYFRFGAVRQVISLNPSSLRENRLGSVMLRAQQLWSGGSVTALVSPHLQDTPSEGPFSVDLGATNGSTRWQLALSQRLPGDWAPQLLLTGESHHSPQVGLNLTHLLSPAAVAFVEVSTGHDIPGTGTRALRTQLATGFTYTTAYNLSLTLEYERNEAALTDDQWRMLLQGSLADFQRIQAEISRSQDLPDRQALFLLGKWTDMGIRHLDLAGFVRMDLADHSRLQWAELRYRWPHMDLALQGQRAEGSATSIYGHLTPRSLGQLVVDVYLP